MLDCIDLRTIAGNRYRLAHDHKPDVRATDDPWLLTIPAQFGHFYPHSAELIGFATNSRGPMARKLAALSFVTITQEGSDGYNLTFPAERFAEVALIARPKRRRQLTPEQRQAAIDRLADFRFSPAGGAQESGQIRVGTALDVLSAASPPLEAAQ